MVYLYRVVTNSKRQHCIYMKICTVLNYVLRWYAYTGWSQIPKDSIDIYV